MKHHLIPIFFSFLDRYGVEVTARGESNQFLALLQSLQDPRNLLVMEKVSLLVGRTRPRLTLTFRVTKIRIAESRSDG